MLFGGKISTERMLQSAAWPEVSCTTYELIAATLLHYVGHLTCEFGTYLPEDKKDKYHDTAGGDMSAPFFPLRVSKCIRLHLAAKRYLCARELIYFYQLSTTSIYTLLLQGDPMCEDEVVIFEANPYYQDAVKIPKWEDHEKAFGGETKSFIDYAPMLQKIVGRHFS
jgi:predicted HD phosphohydrolase